MIPFSEYARSRLALLRAAQTTEDTTLVEKREFSKYTRIILADDEGNPYPLNMTPSQRMELTWSKSSSSDPVLSSIKVFKEGCDVREYSGAHVVNMVKFKHWYVQASYCFYD